MKYIIRVLLLMVSGFTIGCSDYLDGKPDLSLALPNTVKDLQALLDYEFYFSQNYISAGDIASDFYHIGDDDWGRLPDAERQIYVWDRDADLITDWTFAYTTIFYCNIVLDEIDDAALGESSDMDRERVKGLAYFYRGWHAFLLSQHFAPPFIKETATTDLGIPLRTNPDINISTKRSTLKETFDQVLSDLEKAATLLPLATTTPLRPAKAAAYAALTRVSLVMGDWEETRRHADSCLSLQNTLMDFNELNVASQNPIEPFNVEVLMHARSRRATILTSRYAKVDTMLYQQYAENDLRKHVLYHEPEIGIVRYRGSYTGDGESTAAFLFAGLAINEVYLSKAEAQARQGDFENAMGTLNRLLEKRHLRNSWKPIEATNAEDALFMVLQERFKELAFWGGGTRWADLRRLNADARFSNVLNRRINGQEYQLLPKDLRYTFLIPSDVISLSGLPQNQR